MAGAEGAGTADLERRAALREAAGSWTEVEVLSKTAFALSGPSSRAVVDVSVLRPPAGPEDKAWLLDLVQRSLAEETPGTWFANDRFSKKTVPGTFDSVVEIVFPADGRDINKRRTQVLTRLLESPELFASVTRPRLVDPAAARDQWVANIIEGRKEQEHVVQELGCDQVLVVKDYKWQDTANTNNLYYLALFRDLAVRSLRDLRGGHLAALRRLRAEVLPGLAAKHDVQPDQLLAYVHYHPTFWYFHVHVVSCKHAIFTGNGSENLLLSAMDRFHKLETIIALLEANPEYYATASLPVLLPAHQLSWYGDADAPAAKRAKTAEGAPP